MSNISPSQPGVQIGDFLFANALYWTVPVRLVCLSLPNKFSSSTAFTEQVYLKSGINLLKERKFINMMASALHLFLKAIYIM